MQVQPGQPQPLGATLHGDGTNFAVESAPATAVDLCLLDGRGHEVRVPLTARTGDRWHGFVPGVGAGQRYGFRVHGSWSPGTGARFNPSKLLLDPRARAVDGTLNWDATVFDHQLDADGSPHRPLRMDRSDSAGHLPCSIVVDPAFDWEGDAPPQTPWHETVIYEAHVRGLTQQHPDVPESQRGTYAAVAHPAVIEHLRGLEVTAVELLPVHHFLDEQHLVEAGLTNYWGYNPIAFCAPHTAYAAGGNGTAAVHELKTMVKALHAAGIEVILDVVYNHSAEGGPLGPTLAFRGLDEAGHYRLDPDDATRSLDTTGTGGSLDASKGLVRRLILDSLRLWVSELHVDGFRFDLATALARNPQEFDPDAVLFELIDQDPVLRTTKLIAEPWDVGPDGYQLGRFPIRWSEWNDRFRDSVRDLWRGHPVRGSEVRYRLGGSGDLFGGRGRPVRASINFVTCHDGFTLSDLVSYERKHNEANGEGNRDGADHNRSSNGGVEGPTDDPSIIAARDRRRRALLATLYLSRGVPMLLAGDELGRTQNGNNNAYCQDGPLSWLDWRHVDADFLACARRLGALQEVRRCAATRGVAGAGHRPHRRHGRGRRMVGSRWSAVRGRRGHRDGRLLRDLGAAGTVRSRDGRSRQRSGRRRGDLLQRVGIASSLHVAGAPRRTGLAARVRLGCTDGRTGRSRPASGRHRSRSGGRFAGRVGQLRSVQLNQRPPRRSRRSGMPKHVERCSGVRAESIGPDTTSRPPARSRAWVKPVGISSVWWVTSTMGRSGSCSASDVSRVIRSSRAARSSPAAGSSRSRSSGSFIRVLASWTRCRSPAESVPKRRSARSTAPTRASSTLARSRSVSS